MISEIQSGCFNASAGTQAARPPGPFAYSTSERRFGAEAAVPPTPRARHPFTEWLILFGTLVALGSGLVYHQLQDYSWHGARESERLARQRQALERGLAARLNSAARSLAAIRARLPGRGASRASMNDLALRLQMVAESNLDISGLRVINAAGRIIAAHDVGLIGTEFSGIGRMKHLANTLPVEAPRLVLNKHAAQALPSIAIVQTITGAGGEFDGLVYAELKAEVLDAHFDAIRHADDVRITLTLDGVILFAIPAAGASGYGNPVTRAEGSSHAITLTSLIGVGDAAAADRSFSTQGMIAPTDIARDQALSLTLSRDHRAVFETWHRESIRIAAIYATLVLAAIAWLAFNQRRQRIWHQFAHIQESALLASTQRLNEARCLARIGSWSLDLNTHELSWSDEVFRLFEIDPKITSGLYQAFIETVHPEDRKAVMDTYRDSLTRRTVFEITHRLRMKDGRIKWVHERCVSTFDLAGRALASQGTVQDVTERKLADLSLAASEARLRAFFDAAPDTLLISDAQGRITLVNRRVENLLGYTPEELIGRSIDTLVPDRVRHGHAQLRQSFLDSDVTRRMGDGLSTQARHKDGSNVDVEVSLARIATEDGTFLACGLRDVTDRRQQEERTRKLMMINETILSHALVGIVYLKHRHIVSCNRRVEEIFQYAPGELVGQSSELLYDTRETFDRIGDEAYRTVAEGRNYTTEVMLRHKDGSVFWGALSGRAVDPAQPQEGSIWIYADLTERKQAEADLRIAAAAFESQQAMMITDATGTVLRINGAFTRSTGYDAADIVGKTPSILKSGRHDPAFYRDMWNAIRSAGEWQGEVWDRRKNGEIYPKWLTISSVRSAAGELTHYIGTHHDMSERKKADERIHDLAFHDQLTGLPNRTLLMDRLKQIRAAGSRNDRLGAVLFIDLDNFKTINDTMGHDKGDVLLRQVAQRLKLCVRAGDTVARLGGDEFVVVMADLSPNQIEAATDVEMIAEKVIDRLGEPYRLDNVAAQSSASIGITLFMGQFDSIDELMKQADLALYKAKDAGRNTFRFFDPAMESAVKERVAMEEDLRQALDRKQFLLHYQAQIDDRGRLTGAEVLVRWSHPMRGMVSPAEFIPLAEETGLIQPLGHWVLKTACYQLSEWSTHEDLAHLTIAVNVSARQFGQPDFVEQVQGILRACGTDPSRLKLELTESLLVENVQEIIAKMAALKERGIGFSLDDFGTGYSSLSYLKRLPLDQLKIDQSFVRDVLTDPNDASIARTIVALGKSLGLSVIAEGVETEAQKQFLANAGCNAYQGYLFSRPLPVDRFEDYASNWLRAT